MENLRRTHGQSEPMMHTAPSGGDVKTPRPTPRRIRTDIYLQFAELLGFIRHAVQFVSDVDNNLSKPGVKNISLLIY